ncbi:MAG: ribonuclease D [Alphaproteobacteria bacterium]
MIQTTKELQSLCARLHKLKFITVDTEFIREKTFYPELCLIQIGGDKGAWVIDALAQDIDLSALFDVLRDKNVIKVFHACRQDIEIFYHLMHEMPTPVFDTQVGAMVCGYSKDVGYQHLVKDYLGVELDKGMRVTDWSHRPLTPEQEKYALHDVIELKAIYTKMMDEICRANRLDWIQEEIEASLDPFLYEPDAAHLLEKMHVPFQNPSKIHLLARLCEWREKWAKQLNLPRSYIISDNSLIECAAIRPQRPEDFQRLRALSPKFWKNEIGQSLSQFCLEVASEPPQEWPASKHYVLRPNKKNRVEALRLLLNVVAEENQVAPSLIASTEDLVQYLYHPQEVRFMKGWRYQIYGKRVQDLMAGKLAFCYDPVKKALVVRSI